jgi:hypothetical protein
VNEYNTYKEVNSLLGELIAGYSFLEAKNLYFKHPTSSDISYADQKYIYYYKQALKSNVQTSEQRIQDLIKENAWTSENDKRLLELKIEISNLRQTKSKMFISKQVKEISEKIKDREKEYDELKNEKDELIGETAEIFALKKSNEYFMLSLFYKDENLKESMVDKNNLEEIFMEDVRDIYIDYGVVSNKFNSKNLKKIAALPTIINASFLIENSVIDFFGKDILHLTIYQLDVFSKMKAYKGVLSKSNSFPPDELYENFEQLVNWYESSGTSYTMENKTQKKKENVGGSYVGATKQEMEKMAKNQGEVPIDLAQEAAKKGGELSFKDIMKLHE